MGNRYAHALGELVTVGSDVAHPLVYTGMMVPLPALVTHPGGNVLNNHERIAVPEVFTPLLRFQVPFAAQGANLAGHI